MQVLSRYTTSDALGTIERWTINHGGKDYYVARLTSPRGRLLRWDVSTLKRVMSTDSAMSRRLIDALNNERVSGAQR